MANGKTKPKDEKHYEGRDLEAMAEARNYQQWILALLQPYLKGDVCEVGAGVGSCSLGILGMGINSLVSLEPAENLFPTLEQGLSHYENAYARNAGLSEFTATREPQFDSIVYLNVLEHIEDDCQEIGVAKSALKPGGHLCVLVPAMPFLYSPFDRSLGHYRRYTKKSLSDVATSRQLEVVKLHYMDVLGAAPWFVNFVLLRRTMSGGAVRLYDRLGIPLTRAIERILPVPFGKNLLLVAQKPQ